MMMKTKKRRRRRRRGEEEENKVEHRHAKEVDDDFDQTKVEVNCGG
jgi:hypothetical protein